MKKKSPVSRLLSYAGKYKALTFTGIFLSAVAMIMGMIPYLCIWLVVRALLSSAPDFTKALSAADYGWIAFASCVAGIIIYFIALMLTHLSAFRTASNIRKKGMERLMHVPLGFFDNNASGLCVQDLTVLHPKQKLFLLTILPILQERQQCLL